MEGEEIIGHQYSYCHFFGWMTYQKYTPVQSGLNQYKHGCHLIIGLHKQSQCAIAKVQLYSHVFIRHSSVVLQFICSYFKLYVATHIENFRLKPIFLTSRAIFFIVAFIFWTINTDFARPWTLKENNQEYKLGDIMSNKVLIMRFEHSYRGKIILLLEMERSIPVCRHYRTPQSAPQMFFNSSQ